MVKNYNYDLFRLCFALGCLIFSGCDLTMKENALAAINREVHKNSEAYRTLKRASETIGHRLTGSENGHRAETFVYELFQSYGFEDVSYQPFNMVAWSRGEVSLQVGLADRGPAQDLKVVSLAHTPESSEVSAALADLGNGLESDYLHNPGKAEGKIALVYLGLLPETPDGEQNLHRSEKTALAIKYGAKGIIFINQVEGGVLLTGTASVTGELIDIPAVCIGKEDGLALRLKMDKQPHRAHIKMTNFSKEIQARNIIARLPGSELPEEKIIIGGHLDSWDLASGAIDNGIGSFAVIDMARTFKALDLKPRRTMEFVLFMGEEQGLFGSTHMVNSMIEAQELNKVKYMVNVDMAGNPVGFNAGARSEAEAFFHSAGERIKAVDSTFANRSTNRVGLHSDHQPFLLEGIPTMSLTSNLDRSIYRCYHSDCDNFDLVNPQHIKNTVRFTSMVLYELANTASLPAERLSSERNKDFLIANNLKRKLVIGGDWRWGE